MPERRARRPLRTTWRGLRAAVRVLTPLGWGVLLLGCAAVALGMRLHWHEFLVLGTVGLALVGLALLWVLLPGRVRTDVTVRPSRVTQGRTATVHLRVRSGAIPLMYPLVHVPYGQTPVSVRLPFLGPYAEHEEVVQLPPRPRGVYALGPVQYQKSDPLGLARRDLRDPASQELLVRPAVTTLDLFAGGLTNDLEGATSQELSMSDLAFHALREYVRGDDLRHVHWRSSAKAGELLVRQYQETRRGHVTVLLDHERSSYARRADFELAVSIATSVALRAVRDDFDTYFRCDDQVVRGRAAEPVLDAACRFARSGHPYGQVVASSASAVPRTGLVVLVTGAARASAELGVNAARFNRDAARIVVRADTRGETQIRDAQGAREMTITQLDELRRTLAGALR